MILHKMIKENHVIDEQSQIIFIKSSHLHGIEEADSKTKECFFRGAKPTGPNFLPKWQHKLGQNPSVGYT